MEEWEFPEDGDPADLSDLALLPYHLQFCDTCTYHLSDCQCKSEEDKPQSKKS